MTEKLKTLKDFERDKTAVGWNNCLELLKAEAIKWVKEEDWEDFWKWLRNKKGVRLGDSVGVELACYFIEYFFNITEDDLK